MLDRLKQGWRELKRGQPGRRFQDRYLRRRDRARASTVRKCSVIGAGVLLVLAGILFLPLPGPGFLIIAAGALLMAGQSWSIARALDSLETTIRKLLGG